MARSIGSFLPFGALAAALALCGLVSAGCFLFGDDEPHPPPGPQGFPDATNTTEARPASREHAAARRVAWQPERYLAGCAHCGADLPDRTEQCPHCKGPLLWFYPEYPNTPEGAFEAYKLGTLYRDLSLLRTVVEKKHLPLVEELFTLAAAPVDREQLSASRIVKKQVGDTVGVLTVKTGLYQKPLGVILEDDTWKITFDLQFTRRARETLQKLAESLQSYDKDTGSYPQGSIITVIRTLCDPTLPETYFSITAADLDPRGGLLDPWGRRYVYRENRSRQTKTQDMLHPDAYDLYSVGPDGIDQGGGGDDLVAPVPK